MIATEVPATDIGAFVAPALPVAAQAASPVPTAARTASEAAERSALRRSIEL
jgi:hypothetical protein